MKRLVLWYLEKEKEKVVTLRDENNFPVNSVEEHQLVYYQQLLMSINKVIQWLA